METENEAKKSAEERMSELRGLTMVTSPVSERLANLSELASLADQVSDADKVSDCRILLDFDDLLFIFCKIS